MRLSTSIVVAWIVGSVPAASQGDGKALLDEIRAAPVPAQQSDLDTLKLASAHRERAATFEERTNGLWQSWLVSVCEGCGSERKLYSDKDAEDLIGRAKSARNEDNDTKTKQKLSYTKPSRPEKYMSRASLYLDLATENIDQIRRNPKR